MYIALVADRSHKVLHSDKSIHIYNDVKFVSAALTELVGLKRFIKTISL